MPEPNWSRFAWEVDWTPNVHAAIQHSGLKIPLEGRPNRFSCPSAIVTRCRDGSFYVFKERGASLHVPTGAEVIDALQLMPGYEAALRAWLQMWGAWSPPAKAQPTEPTPPPILL